VKHYRAFAALGFGFGVGLAVLGCRSEPRGKSAAPARSARADAGRSGAEDVCELLHTLPALRKAKCCGSVPSRFLYDECVRSLGQALASNAVTLDQAAVGRCRASLTERYSGCDWVTPGQPLPGPECRRLVLGRLELGASCDSSLECRRGLHCDGAAAGQRGTCAAPVALGVSCGSSVDALGAYLLDTELEREHPRCRDFCSRITHRCEPSPRVGATCAVSSQCAPDQRCESGICAAGAVARRGAGPGQACQTDFDCEIGGCLPRENVCGGVCRVSLDALESTAHAPVLGLSRPETAR
jgi:hypothetical protein